MSQAAGQQRIWRKSTRSQSTGNGDCVEVACAHWRKSTRSANTGNGDCVEARPAPAGFELRDSKLGSDSPIFALPTADFTTLLGNLKSGAGS
ncbi:DUF397 domain-containing protein [Glycomyces sp. NPDC021274]|uniref:DUF397 domain-containing protein n=1 Tax=Glycomyces sp. NPDC021274 TaxID=3155120 RepID=UPI0033CB6270